jgi:hypothetical protein
MLPGSIPEVYNVNGVVIHVVSCSNTVVCLPLPTLLCRPILLHVCCSRLAILRFDDQHVFVKVLLAILCYPVLGVHKSQCLHEMMSWKYAAQLMHKLLCRLCNQ